MKSDDIFNFQEYKNTYQNEKENIFFIIKFLPSEKDDSYDYRCLNCHKQLCFAFKQYRLLLNIINHSIIKQKSRTISFTSYQLIVVTRVYISIKKLN